MNWWGKLLGGGFGFLIGGPIGAMVGAVLGHNFDSGLKKLQHESDEDLSPGTQERVQATFFTATFATMGHLAKVDGKVTKDEIKMAEHIMSQMQLTAEQRRVAIDLFNQGKSADYDLRAVVEQFRIECRRRTNLMRMFVEIQLHAVYADGHMHPAEREMLEEICGYLKFPGFMLRQMEILVRAGRTTSGSGQSRENGGQRGSRAQSSTVSVADSYALLDVDTSAEQAAVKRAYRKLMSQHHPDKLVSKGLPPEMIRLATEKTQHIKAAYEVIKEHRGWK
ncbi:molecular chaperone DjlA [Chromatiales bacterium (ex Bugula neritina AB1)]|nr:molecular chaperone DjlA [Chromatiales bacterium (ex Bugula neritina AB1)]